MPRPTIEYLNARRALMPASGGAKQDHSAKYMPDRELDICGRTELECESAWSDYRIRADVMWQQIFERLGLDQGYELGETF
jgi:hypothetical protein